MRKFPLQVCASVVISFVLVTALESKQPRALTSAELVAQTFSELATWMPSSEWAFCYRNGRLSWRSVCV